MRSREFNKTVKTAIPFLFLYDAGGNQIYDTTGSFIVWDTKQIETSDFQYTEDTDRIQFISNTSGYYQLMFDCSFDGQGNTCVLLDVYLNGTLKDGSALSATVPNACHNSVTLNYVIFLKRGDYLQIKCTAGSNKLKTIANSSRLIIEYLPMEGANNRAAGNPPKLLR